MTQVLKKTLFFFAILFVSFLLSCQREKEIEPHPTDRPNIVLIVIDTLRADGLSSYGNPRPTSPNLDRLAEESHVFMEGYSVGANTSVSMASLMTGRLPFYSEDTPPCSGPGGACPERWNERTWFGLQRFSEADEIGISRSLTTLPELLQSAGYFTAGFVTNVHLKERYNFDQGFAVYEEIFRDEYPIYGTGEMVAAGATKMLSKISREPFFLFLHFMEPHAPYMPEPQYQDLVGPLPKSRHWEGRIFKDWEIDYRSIKEEEIEEVVAYARGLYDAEVRHVDAQIGAVLRALQERDLYDDTLIVVTADHGEQFYEHGRMGHTGQLFDELLHVPLILKVPGRSGVRHSDLVRNFDVMPTLLDYAEVSPPEDCCDAASLRGIIEGAPASEKRFVYSSFPFLQVRRMYRDERYKLIYHPEQPERSLLFDLREDPHEKTNLYRSKPEIAARLISQLDRLTDRLRQEGSDGQAAAPLGPDAETRKQLEAVGYLQPLPEDAGANDHAAPPRQEAHR